MHSNRPSITPKLKNGIPLIGQEIQQALMDPKSPFSQDLKNAITNALLAKEARHKLEIQHLNTKILELKIEEVENELAKYIAAFENYYKQLELAVADVQLSSNTNTTTNNLTSSYNRLLHSLALYTQALTVIDKELLELDNKRQLLHQDFINNQKACGVAFDKILENPTKKTYVVGNETYHLDLDKVPKEHLTEVKEEFQKARDEFTDPKTAEQWMNAFPDDHPLKVNFTETGGMTNRQFFHRSIRRELTLTRATLRFITASKQAKMHSDPDRLPRDAKATHVTRNATQFAQLIAKGLESFQTNGNEISRLKCA